jgi:hypothetical protein
MQRVDRLRARRVAQISCASVVCLSVAAILVLVGLPGGTQGPRAAVAAPSAAAFAYDFVGTANAHAKAHGDSARFSNVHCVQASAGRYMCSYAVIEPDRPPACHVMQARWTPDGDSTITITLAGRTARCESLRAALRSLP